MLKRKKSSSATISLPPKTSAVFEQAGQELLIDDLAKTLRNYGFQQILPKPIEERSVYYGESQLHKHFGPKILEVGTFAGVDLVLPPTYLPGVFKRFFQNIQAQGPHVTKWFYLAPIVDFNEQKLETAHELGIFILGEKSTLAYAQLVNTACQVFRHLGIEKAVTELNHQGCANCQKDYQELLSSQIGKAVLKLCENCQENLGHNPVAVFNCEQISCQMILGGASHLVDYLDEPCRNTLVGFLETLDELGLAYSLNSRLSHPWLTEQLSFRLQVEDSQRVLGYGGNFGSWGRFLGGTEELPLLGFLSLFEDVWAQIPPAKRKPVSHVEVFVVPLGEIASRRTLVLHRALQEAGIVTGEAMLGSGGIKNQLKEASDRRSEIALIVGQREALEETVILRDLRSGIQEVFATERIVEEVKKRLGK